MELWVKVMIGIAAYSVCLLIVCSPLLRTLGRNRKQVRDSEALGKAAGGTPEQQQELIDRWSGFELVTLPCPYPIQEVRTRLLQNIDSFTNALGVAAVSECFAGHFLLTGSFIEELPVLAGRHIFDSPPTFKRYYEADILFRKNEDSSLTLLSAAMPEDKKHDLFIRDFTLRLKEILL